MLHTEMDSQNNVTEAMQPIEKIMDTLHQFFDWEPAKTHNSKLWNLLVLAISSKDVDSYTAQDRSDLLFSYQLITELLTDLEEIYKGLENQLTPENGQ